MSVRPLGVNIVAWLTLFCSLVLFFVFFTGMILAGVGGWPGPEPHPFDWTSYMLAIPIIPASLVLSGCAFLVSMGMFTTSIGTSSAWQKYVWYASILFWIITFIFFSWWSYGFWRKVGIPYYGWEYAEVMSPLLPLAYSIGCLIYFQNASIKDYFMINTAKRMPNKEAMLGRVCWLLFWKSYVFVQFGQW